MKTILDKVDPKYLECSTGACEHASHQFNAITWVVVGIVMLNIVILLTREKTQ